jgi:hypothetical protein
VGGTLLPAIVGLVQSVLQVEQVIIPAPLPPWFVCPLTASTHKERYLGIRIKRADLTVEVPKFSYTNIAGPEYEKLQLFHIQA